jgi:2-oxoglutarate ferredoxin oxidoreductase subunit alpha
VAQQDVMQARWGSHGDYGIIALAPDSPQEAFELTLEAFRLAERYRTPVVLLSDEVVGHMTEKVMIPEAEKIQQPRRRRPRVKPKDYAPYSPEADGVPPMADAGEGYRVHMTGLTHDEYGYPTITPDAQERLVQRLVRKIRDNADEIVRVEELGLEDAEVVVVSYGCSARTSFEVVETARESGLKVGMLRLVTVWPFPEKKVRELAAREAVKAFVVAELNHGQVAHEVERCAAGQADTVLFGFMGGRLFTPDELYRVVEEVAR